MATGSVRDGVFYHIYPLGLLGAPQRNDFSLEPQPRLNGLRAWIPHLRQLGITDLYLGPLFESTTHGYDTADYYHLDRRLGTDENLRDLIGDLHNNHIRVILDGVFNHVGRDFWAFRDLRQNGVNSPYVDWFKGITFSSQSPMGDPFTYKPWSGHYDLVELNLHNPAVRQHLLDAVSVWINDFGIDGLRLDVADCLDLDFQRDLAAFCRTQKPGFWLMGEVIHGDYRRWANPQTLDSVTNYEIYKGLYSSLVDKNYFEIAYALNRQFGEAGLYRGLPLYNFADNHDVSRVASSLTNHEHLYPLYCLLFTMPGIPSIYYGSEWGLAGVRTPESDIALRPALDLGKMAQAAPHPGLLPVLQRLVSIRKSSLALRLGNYTQLFVSQEQLAFSRETQRESVIVLLNAAAQPAGFDFPVDLKDGTVLTDILNKDEKFQTANGRLVIGEVQATWARILKTDS
ncbi:MAG TPA: alpha-amylase family glycosyl hydrolase [Anaerolineales bacterium]|nr:alpha-amylase family glycosyl hydrolase [Anaerolineales bacterium]